MASERPKKMDRDYARGEGARTAPPPFDPEDFARQSESMLVASPTHSLLPTVPPNSSYNELRESCSAHMLAAKAITPPSQDAMQSEVRALSSSPASLDASRVLPSSDSVPRLAVAAEDLEWFGLDSEAIALLAKVNGADSIETIAASCTVDMPDAQEIFYELEKAGAVELRSA